MHQSEHKKHNNSLDYNSDASTQHSDSDTEAGATAPVSLDIKILGIVDKNANNAEGATVKRPKKHFQNDDERENFVRQYQIKYKTEMCRNWELFGRCKFQDKCSFAHGDHELMRKVHLPQNYKTKPCIQFHTTAYCPYGNRCQFLHSTFDIYREQKFNPTTVLAENTRLSEERANLTKEGHDLLNYVNVF